MKISISSQRFRNLSEYVKKLNLLQIIGEKNDQTDVLPREVVLLAVCYIYRYVLLILNLSLSDIIIKGQENYILCHVGTEVVYKKTIWSLQELFLNMIN